MIPQYLLDRLKEADPDLWQRYYDLVWDARTDFIGEAVLQAVLQDAILARGWIFELNSKLCDEGLFAACIFENLNEWKKDQFDPTIKFKFQNGDTEADALLKVYLTALEAK